MLAASCEAVWPLAFLVACIAGLVGWGCYFMCLFIEKRDS